MRGHIVLGSLKRFSARVYILNPRLCNSWRQAIAGYVLLSDKELRVAYVAERKFGSGDDSYSLKYGALVDRNLDKQAILAWRLSVYMPYNYKPAEFPMIFRRCAAP